MTKQSLVKITPFRNICLSLLFPLLFLGLLLCTQTYGFFRNINDKEAVSNQIRQNTMCLLGPPNKFICKMQYAANKHDFCL